MTDSIKNEIVQLRRSGVGYGRISRQLGIPLSTVKSYCRRHNVVGGVKGTVCMQCGHHLEQVPHRKKKKFCSDGCRITWWNHHKHLMPTNSVCVHCGKAFHGRNGCKYCSHQCYVAERFGGKDDQGNVTA